MPTAKTTLTVSCPHCGNPLKNSVVKTRHEQERAGLVVTKRQRACPSCYATFTTVEKPETPPEPNLGGSVYGQQEDTQPPTD